MRGPRPGALEALVGSGSPREVLARLLDGDPLGIEPRVHTWLADVALLVDAERLVLRTMARVAFAGVRWRGDGDLAVWLDALVDRAATDLMDEDRAAERAGSAPDAGEARYVFLAEALGVAPAVARRACVVFNDLPAHVRRTWWAAVVERKSLARCVSEVPDSPRRVRADLRRALLTLSLLRDPGGPVDRGGDPDV